MRQKIANIVLSIIFLIDIAVSIYFFNLCNSIPSSGDAGEAIGAAFSIILVLSMVFIFIIVSIVCFIVSLINIKGANKCNKIISIILSVCFIGALIINILTILML